MRSQLDGIRDWEKWAEVTYYSPGKLAKACGVTLRQLERYFSNTAGKPPRLWLNDLRLQKALELIRSGHSVKEVAVALGYKERTHFSRQFWRVHGVAPSKCRKPQITGSIPDKMSRKVTSIGLSIRRKREKVAIGCTGTLGRVS